MKTFMPYPTFLGQTSKKFSKTGMFDRCASSRTILQQPKSVNVQKMVNKQVVTVVQNSGPLFQKSFQVPEERRNPVAEEKLRGENTSPVRNIFTFVIRTGRRMRSPPSIETGHFHFLSDSTHLNSHSNGQSSTPISQTSIRHPSSVIPCSTLVHVTFHVHPRDITLSMGHLIWDEVGWPLSMKWPMNIQ